MQSRTLPLTAAQRTELEQTRAHDRRAYLREIAAALLKVADGQSAHQVARHGLHRPRDPDTLYRWLDVYAAEGLAGLVHKRRGHRGFSPSAGGNHCRHRAPGTGLPRHRPQPVAPDRCGGGGAVPARVQSGRDQ